MDLEGEQADRVVDRSGQVGAGVRRPPDAPLKELRLAVVCYGGVSLAVYMHGITKELHKLVMASKGLEQSPDEDPFQGRGTESVYWGALRQLRETQQVRTRVVVDIVSGTSAGGINGIFLAKALASNLSQDALRDIWMERADLRELLRSRLPGLPLKATSWMLGSAAGRLVGRSARPPLDGDRMLQWLHEALDSMDADAGEGVLQPREHSLLPDDEVMELFVTATDLSGYTRWVSAYSPKQVPDIWHRHVFEFRSAHDGGRLGREYNAALAFAARATSCFPGAFPPIAIQDVTRVLAPPNWPGSFAADFAPIYRLSDRDVEEAYFVDGGVLDNRPFGLAIRAIERKPAWTEVDRRLLYVEPDPMVPTAGEPSGDTEEAPASLPGMIGTIWAGLSTIPRHEPILTDLQLIRGRNDRVGQIEDVVRSAREQVASEVSVLLESQGAAPGSSWEDFTAANGVITEKAAERAGVGHLTYVRVKLRGIVEQLASVAASICSFPEDSNHADFLRAVLEQWAQDEGYLEWVAQPTKRQLDFIRAFDLGYRERRIRFTIARLNELYDGVERRTERPFRGDLDSAKGALWNQILKLRAIVESIVEAKQGPGADIARTVRSLFDPDRISGLLTSSSRPETVDEVVAQFTEEAAPELDRARDLLEAYLVKELKDFSGETYRIFLSETGEWTEDLRNDLLVRYLGFPYWDRLIYPLLRVGNVVEMNRIEVIRVSPNDVKALGQLTAKEKLKGVDKGHFGAFFKREYRENDYVWGRLDGAERLLWMLFDVAGQSEGEDSFYLQAFKAIVDEESPNLKEARPVYELVRRNSASAG